MILAKKNRYENQWNRIEDSDINACRYAHLVFHKGAQNIHGKKTTSSANVAGKNCISTCRKLKLAPCISSCKSVNSKWIKDVKLNLKL
jgi:hypothetical protein